MVQAPVHECGADSEQASGIRQKALT